MTESPAVQSLRDPLSQLARNKQKMLLVTSTISIFICRAQVIPERISALGIEFTKPNQSAFLTSLALVVAYFICAFAIYGSTDWLAWKLNYDAARGKNIGNFYDKATSPIQDRHESDRNKFVSEIISPWVRNSVKPASIIRSIFEFATPLFIGIIAIALLLCTTTAP